MEDTFQAACEARHIPGAVLLAANRSGDFQYRKVFGVRSLESHEPLGFDSVMWLASCTKLATSICAMQCVERGLVTLDQDVRPLIPELQTLDILASDKDGNITSTSKNNSPITLRQLLSHSSGYRYDFISPTLQQWRKQQVSNPAPTSVRKRFGHPLLYEPGTSWSYGPSIDWAGVLVEHLTGLPLQNYMEKNIWEPLGITNMTFFLSTRPDMLTRRVLMSWRADGSEVMEAAQPGERNPVFDPDFEDAQGGGGIFSGADEYFKIVHALFRATDASASDAEVPPPTQLLRRSTANLMFEPQLNESGRKALMNFTALPRFNHAVGNMPLGTAKDYSLAGMLVREDIPGWRRKDTLTWGGTPNLTWFIDRETGICGLYATQVMPNGDPKSNELLHVFEKAIYERYAAFQRNKSS